MKFPVLPKEKLKFWQEKLQKYQQQYNDLRKQSPGRWWHDEHFENQMKVLEASIISAKKRVSELKKKVKN